MEDPRDRMRAKARNEALVRNLVDAYLRPDPVKSGSSWRPGRLRARDGASVAALAVHAEAARERRARAAERIEARL